jgi:hypothetical protein
MPLPDQTCPHCGKRVFRKHESPGGGAALEVVHEPDTCGSRPKKPHEDAPAPAPGTGDGRMRYGRPAGSEAPAVGMPPIPFVSPRAEVLRC